MSDPSTAKGRTTIPWGVLGAIGLVALAEAWVSRHALDLSSRGVATSQYAAQTCRKAAEARVLCLGDSLVKHGVVPRAIEDRLGRKTLNLAVPNGVAPLTYYLMARALDAGARPEVIVLDFKATQLQVDPRDQVDELASALTVGECLDLAVAAKDPVFLARLIAARHLPSLRSRWGLRGSVVAALAGRPVTTRADLLALIRNWNVNQGGGLFPKNPQIEHLAEFWDEPFYDRFGDWFPQPLNAVYVRRCLALAARRKIPVVWLAPPINPKIQAKRDRRRYDDNYTRMLRQALTLFPNLTVVDGRHAGYPLRLYIDSAHLDYEGAYTFSDDLAALLPPILSATSRPPAGRWLEFPPYRARPVPTDLEDEHRSRLALLGGGKPASPPALPVANRPASGETTRR